MTSKDLCKNVSIDVETGLATIDAETFLEIKQDLEVLEILKNRSYIVWVEKGVLYSGRDGDIQVPLDEEDFESEEDYKLIKEYFEKEEKI